MKRTPLKRKTPLKRTTPLLPGKLSPWNQDRTNYRLGKTSKKREKALREYSAWRRVFLSENTECQLGAPGCTKIANEVHHVLKLSHGGAMVPGAKADRQGQRFMASCRYCNRYVEDYPAEALKRGWVILTGRDTRKTV